MKQRTFIIIIVLLSTLTANAYDAEINGIFYNLNTSTMEAEVTSGDNKYTGNITIPNTVTYNNVSYSVTSIGKYAFAVCDGLTSVTIPSSMTTIGDDAFHGCGLTSVTIPSSVTNIGIRAFGGCSSLGSIDVDAGNTNYDSRDNCNAIIETATNTLTVGCKDTAIPNSVTTIGSYAFYQCYSLTSITIPNSVTNIGDDAFAFCSGLTSVIIPNSVTTIGWAAFHGCGLISITIPNSVTTIGDYAFYQCYSLTSITIPSSVTTIGDHAFYQCYSLTSITFPGSVTTIGDYAFDGCSSLTSVTIPSSVTNIGIRAFGGCSSLGSIDVDAGNTNYDSRDNCNAIIETATNTLIVGCKDTAIPNSVTTIGSYAFDGCSGLTSVIIPNSVTTIGEGAFCECSGLTSVTIPSSVTTIGDHAFEGCSGLTSVIIPNSVTTVGWAAFCKCSGLTSVTIPNYVTSIGGSAFCECSGLTSITIGNSVSSIGEYAFEGCDLLEVISKIENPFNINTNTFTRNTFYNAILYVPAGTTDKYKATEGWKYFYFIEEGSPSGVTDVEDERTKEIKRYTLDGRIIINSHKGINIIQMNDGTTKKVLVK